MRRMEREYLFCSCTGLKIGLSYEFAGKSPKKKILIVQVEFGKIISIESRIMFSKQLNGRFRLNLFGGI